MTSPEPQATDGATSEPLHYVVGVDGSPPSVNALTWAIERAAADGAEIRAVTMWHFPAMSVERPSLATRLHGQAEERLAKAVAEARARASAGETVSVTTEVYQFPADLRLIDLSAEAALVIIGRRSRRGLAALGSVSERVASHAHCPVVVIPPGA